MLTLHHNAMSSCSQKVRLVLAEKKLDYQSEVVDLLAGEQHKVEYAALNPNHVVPTLVHDDHVLVESSLINEYLEDAYPETTLRPADAAGAHAMRLWVKRIDERVHPSAAALTYALGPRPLILQQPKEVREASIEGIPDPARRAARRSVIEHGVQAPEFVSALAQFVDLVDDMESALRPGQWLAGRALSLADAAALPYVLRLDQLGLSPLVSNEARPRVADWLARMQSRDSYATAIDAWVPSAVVDVFRKNGEAEWPQIEKLLSSL